MKLLLSAEMKQWVMSRVADGLYPDASAYVCDLIRRDQERAARTGYLQALVTEGIESGMTDISVEGVLALADKEYDQEQTLPA